MKKVILHVGLHKTATSSIQQTLAQSREILICQGFEYPVFSVEEKNIENHSIPFYSLYCNDPDSYHINIRWGVFAEKVNPLYEKQLADSLNSDRDVIFSGEDISILPREGLERLKSYLLSFGVELRVICFVRSPYSYTCSLIQQDIKGGRESLEDLKVKPISTFIDNIKAVFPDAEFHQYDKALKHEAGPVGYFIDLIGIAEVCSYVGSNKGLGNASTRLINFINKRYPSFVDGKINPKRQGHHHFHEDFNFDNAKFLLSETELSVVRKDLDSENKNIERLLGKEFCDHSYPISKEIYLDGKMVDEVIRNVDSLPLNLKICAYDFVKENSYGNFDILEGFFKEDDSLDAMLCRDTAILWESKDLSKALIFMEMAKKKKPAGKKINEKLNQYYKSLGGKREGDV